VLSVIDPVTPVVPASAFAVSNDMLPVVDVLLEPVDNTMDPPNTPAAVLRPADMTTFPPD